MTKKFLLLCSLLTLCFSSRAQKEWTLKLNKDNVFVYTKNQLHSNLKAIKVECTLNTTLTRLVAVILDVNSGAEWVYSTKSSVLLKQVSPGDLYYYSELSLPWPVSNRDFIAHLMVTQDPVTKIVTINGPTVPDYLPAKKDIIRVKNSSGQWILKPLQKNQVKIEYVLETDPGGSLPAWLVNLFVTKGPFETFKKLKGHVNKPAYTNVKLGFIMN
ncbi:MAG: lipid-binding protein [Chitinophagaceae bacterium]|nr:lipid-binding protein [Chitinophagaceae bacterium]